MQIEVNNPEDKLAALDAAIELLRDAIRKNGDVLRSYDMHHLAELRDAIRRVA